LEAGLPANVDAERTILGAVLLDNDVFSRVSQVIRPDDFFLDSHQRIVTRMGQLMKREMAVDIITLSNELAKNGEVEAVGGVAYLASLTEGLPRRTAIDNYVDIVKEKSMLRKAMALCSKVIARASDQADPALEVIGDATKTLEQIADRGMDADGAKIESFILPAFDEMNREYRDGISRRIPSGN